jgi:hypothetical protein
MRAFLIKCISICLLCVAPNFLLGIIRYFVGDTHIPFVYNYKSSFIVFGYEPRNTPDSAEQPETYDLSLQSIEGKKVLKIRDKNGFNNYIENTAPEILFLGDSFFGDPHLHTTEGLQASINEIFGRNCCLNLGNPTCSGFKVYNEMLAKKLIQKPKVIVLEIVERNLQEWLTLKHDLQNNSFKSKPYKNYGLDLLLGNNFREIGKSRLKQIFAKCLSLESAIKNSHHNIDNKKVYFCKNQVINLTPSEIDSLQNNLLFVTKHFKQQGIEIHFLIIPDKESLHPAIFSQTNLPYIQEKMKKIDISMIDLYSLFKDTPEKYYFLEDSHWNKTGIRELTNWLRDKETLK